MTSAQKPDPQVEGDRTPRHATSRLPVIGVLLASTGLGISLVCYCLTGFRLVFALVSGVVGSKRGVEYFLQSSFDDLTVTIGHSGPVFGVFGGLIAIVSLVRSIKGRPLGKADRLCNYVALSTGVLMFSWLIARSWG